MNAPRALAALVLLGSLVPLASATSPLPPTCEPEDVEALQVIVGHRDLTAEVGPVLANVTEGDVILVDGAADVECEGAPVSLTTYLLLDGERVVHSESVQTWFRPLDEADSVYTFVYADVPFCAFEVELRLGDALVDSASGGENDCAALPVPECPQLAFLESTEISVVALFNETDHATEFAVYRAEGDGELELLGAVPRGLAYFIDDSVVEGESYLYLVTGVNHNGESEGCAPVSVTAVPFFGAPVLGALALAGAVGAFAWMRRR